MVRGDYMLGIDIGDATVVTAVRRTDGADERARVLGPADLPAAPGLPGYALRRVGGAVPMYPDGRPVDPADVVAELARQVARRAAPSDGPDPAWTVLTVPPSWAGHRRDVLLTALRTAGMVQVSLVSSAVAVVHRHRAAGSVPEGAPVVVVDVGASTVDTAVVRATAGHPETLAVPPAPLPWGGRDVDDAVLELVRDCLAAEDEGTSALPAELRDACVAAKEALSSDPVACVELPGAAGPLALRLVRGDLEELVAEPLQEVVAAVRRAVAEAGLEVADLAAVVLAGGTAALPLVAETLSAALDRPVVVDTEPALTAALGAAELAGVQGDAVPAEEQPADGDTVGGDTVGGTDDREVEAGAGEEPVTAGAGSRRRSRPDTVAASRTPKGAPRGTRRPGTPSGATRPPARTGSRPPVPPPDARGRRHAARAGVVLAAFLVIVVGVAVAVSTDWAGRPGQEAVAGTATPEQTGASDRPAGGDDAGSGLSPAAAEGRADRGDGRDGDDSDDSDDDQAGSAARGASPTGGSASRSSSGPATTSSAAGTPTGSTGSSGAARGSTSSPAPGTAAGTAGAGGPASAGVPGTTTPPPAGPSDPGQPTSEAPGTNTPPETTAPPTGSTPPEPTPAPVSEPPATTPPPDDPAPAPPTATEEPTPADPSAAAVAGLP